MQKQLEKLYSEIEHDGPEIFSEGDVNFMYLNKELGFLRNWKKNLKDLIGILADSTHDKAIFYISRLEKLDPKPSSPPKKKAETSSGTPYSKQGSIHRIQWVKSEKLKVDEEFENFFHQDPEKIQLISQAMKEIGFDERFPLFVREVDGELTVFDGHGRLQAAIEGGLEEVPIILHKFNARHECLIEAIRIQASRRNLTPRERFKILHYLAKIEAERAKKNQGTRTDLSTSESQDLQVAGNKSLAVHIGMSLSSVNRLKKIMEYPELEYQVCEGELSIRKAYEIAKEQEKCNNVPATETDNQEAQIPSEPIPQAIDKESKDQDMIKDDSYSNEVLEVTGCDISTSDVLDISVKQFFEELPHATFLRQEKSLTLYVAKLSEDLRQAIDKLVPYTPPKNLPHQEFKL